MLRAAVLVVVLLAAAPRTVAAQAFADAERTERAGRLLDAYEQYRSVLAAGGMSVADTARVHLRLGVLARAVGADAAEAEAHFALALAIDSSLAVPAELPPAERVRFEALRGDGYGIEGALEGAELHIRTTGNPPAARSIRVELDGEVRDVPLVDGAAIVTPRDDAPSIDVTALDEYGNTLVAKTVEIDWPDAPEPAAADVPPRVSPLECPATGDPCAWPSRCRPRDASCGEQRGPPWAIIGGVAGAVVVVVAAILITVLAVDAHQASLWRIDRAGSL